jgi:hypothetical protein
MDINSLSIFIFSSLLFIFTFLLTFLKFGYKENPFSSLNLYLYLNFFGFIIFILSYFDYGKHLPNYMQEIKIDKFYLSIDLLLYTLSFSLVYIFLLLLKYKPIYPYIATKFKNSIKNKYDIYLIASVAFFILLIIKFYGNPFDINILNLVRFRYEMTHGYIVAIFIFISPLTYYLILNLRKNNLKKYLIPFLVYIYFYFIFNARGPLIFSVLFALSFYNISTYEILGKLAVFKIRKSLLYIWTMIIGIIFFYWWYSINFRAQIADPINLVLQRLDNFIASYLVMSNNLAGIRLENLFYPFFYIIPRNLFPNKPFPPNGELSSLLFGANLLNDGNITAWSVNFGLVGESLYVGYGLFLIPQSFLIAFSLKIFSWIIRKNSKLSYIEFALLCYLYTYPFSIVMGGVLTPASGTIFIITIFYFFYKYLNNLSKSIRS